MSTSSRTKKALRFPVIPPPLRNHGNFIISLNGFVRWLTAQVEAEGIDVFTGFAGRDVLIDDDRVVGVRTGDRGIDRHGEPKAVFEPGVDILAKVTIFCDGVRGNLTKELLRRCQLGRGRQPEQFAVGIKELWEVPADRLAPGTVIHTMGYPLRHDEFGGGFIYAMPEGRLSVGFVVGLDYKDPLFDPHVAFNRFKQHPLVAAAARRRTDGPLRRQGATRRRVEHDSAAVHGRCAHRRRRGGLPQLDAAQGHSPRDAHRACWRPRRRSRRFDPATRRQRGLERYQRAIDASAVKAELYPVRNVHQAFGYGLFAGLAFAGARICSRAAAGSRICTGMRVTSG